MTKDGQDPRALGPVRARTRRLAVTFCVCVAVLLCSCTSGSSESARPARTNAAVADSAEALDFVNRFYGRYIPLMGESTREPAFFALAREIAGPLNDTLRLALLNEERLQDLAGGAIVHLDADPFVGSQDPCENYEAIDARQTGSAFLVGVYAVCAGTRQSSHSVTLEVRQAPPRWVIVDVHYPGEPKRSLLSLLRR